MTGSFRRSNQVYLGGNEEDEVKSATNQPVYAWLFRSDYHCGAANPSCQRNRRIRSYADFLTKVDVDK